MYYCYHLYYWFYWFYVKHIELQFLYEMCYINKVFFFFFFFLLLLLLLLLLWTLIPTRPNYYFFKSRPKLPCEKVPLLFFLPGSKLVDGETSFQPCAAILQAVGNGVSHLQDGVCASFLKVVAADGDGIELGHVLLGLEGKCKPNLSFDLQNSIGTSTGYWIKLGSKSYINKISGKQWMPTWDV